MKKLIVMVIAIGILSLALGSGLAMAAKPNNQGCFGTDVSATATALGVGWGQLVSSNTEGGFGDGVQAHQAGLIPDEVVPNTCND